MADDTVAVGKAAAEDVSKHDEDLGALKESAKEKLEAAINGSSNDNGNGASQDQTNGHDFDETSNGQSKDVSENVSENEDANTSDMLKENKEQRYVENLLRI